MPALFERALSQSCCVLQAEDAHAVTLGIFISGFTQRERGWENNGVSVRVEIIYRRRGAWTRHDLCNKATRPRHAANLIKPTACT